MKEKVVALRNLVKEIQRIIKRLEKNVVKKEAFKIEIDGEEYKSYNEIMDAYGCDMISEAQKDTALKKYEMWETGETRDVIHIEIDYLNHIAWNLADDARAEEFKDDCKEAEKMEKNSND